MNVAETLVTGENRRITVRFSGTPAPEVEWKRDGESVRGVQIESSATSSSIQINSCDMKKHSGTYTISLRNSAGHASTELTIKVQGMCNTLADISWQRSLSSIDASLKFKR